MRFLSVSRALIAANMSGRAFNVWPNASPTALREAVFPSCHRRPSWRSRRGRARNM